MDSITLAVIEQQDVDCFLKAISATWHAGEYRGRDRTAPVHTEGRWNSVAFRKGIYEDLESLQFDVDE